MKSALFIFGLLAGNAAAHANLRSVEEEESLLLEVVVEGGRRELFPLLPGTKCPAGHQCRARSDALAKHVGSRVGRDGVAPMMALKDNIRTELSVEESMSLKDNLGTVVDSNDYCTRRAAMARAAGLIGGAALATVSSPAFAAETKTVQAGSDSGQLVFVPAKITICKGDSVTWVNNKGGPHNVVFDEDGIPDGVSQESISMDSQMGEEGESFTKKFDTAGTYNYYCEPHRGAGMNAVLIVS
jgi:plastocyanin